MPVKTDIYIRRAEREDLDTVVDWMERPDFQHFLYGDPAHSPQRIREKIVTMLGRSPTQMLPTAVYLMIDSPSRGPVGLLSIHGLSWRNRSCNVDLYIGNEKLRNRHVAALAAFRAIEYCFDELNLHRVGAFIYAFNRSSWRLFEILGAKRELTLRDHVVRDGEWHDVYGYGLLRTEFDRFRRERASVIQRFGLGREGPPESSTTASEVGS